MTLDTKFADGLRAQLVDTAAGRGPVALRSRHTRLAVGLAAGAAAAALLTAGALVVAGIPGEVLSNPLGPTVTQSYTGPAIVDTALTTGDANAVKATFVCTSAGSFSVDHPLDGDGGTGLEWVCGGTDGTVEVGKPVVLGNVPLVDGRVALDVTTEATTTWTVTLQFLNSVTTDWGVNAKGETFGTSNENGVPDLSAAMASNCEIGYIYFTDLMPVDPPENEQPHSIPVYESDGETVIGEFWIGNDMPFCDEK